MWDDNNPLHEWVDYKPTATQTINAQNTRQQDANADKAAIASRNALSTVLDHQGPPNGKARFNEGTHAQPITWLFEPDSFTPMAKLVGDEHYSIITDHLGTPNAVFDKDGKPVWSADISVWGELRNLQGDKDFCPFRYPGQYEDSETGLYYNRFRYYDPEAGRYVSQDPIRLDGGNSFYKYVSDPLSFYDPQGLSACAAAERRAYLNQKFGRTGDLNADINIRTRKKIAEDFYLGEGFEKHKIPDHLKGIDFSQPVEVITVGKGKKLNQYQVAGQPQGNYYAPNSKTRPTELGIAPTGFNRAAQIEEPKIKKQYITTQNVRMLKSKAAPIVDDWSVPNKPFQTDGGGTQFFSARKSDIKVIDQ